MKADRNIPERFDNNIDFLRLLAAIGVVFGHAFVLTGNGFDPLTKLFSAVGPGYETSVHGLSVWFLFFISGSLVTASYAYRHNLKDYLYSRFLRIYPGLLAVVIVTIMLGAVVSHLSFGEYFSDKATWKYFSRNILGFSIKHELPGVFQGNPDHSPNGSLWTIPLELRLYLVIAVMGILGFLKRTNILILVVSAMILWVICAQAFDWMDKSRITSGPVPIFLIGALFFALKSKLLQRWWIAPIGLTVWYLLRGVPVLGHLAFAGSLCYGFFLLTKIPKVRMLDVGKFGDYSYGIYLYSFPIQQILISQGLKNGWVVFLLSLVISFVFAIISWHFIESKALSFKRKAT